MGSERMLWAVICVILSLIILGFAIDATAQTNYVECKSTVSGATSIFPGLTCPTGWIFVRIVQ